MKKNVFATFLLFLAGLLSPKSVSAASPPGGSGPIFTIPNILGFSNLADLIDNIVQLIFFVAGVAFFVNFLIGGIQWINAGGDAKAMDSARNRITNSLIGLIIVVAAFALTRIIENVLGISITGGFRFR